MKETYKQMKERHQKEVNALPIMFAFSDEQFKEGMRKLGLEPTDYDKIYSLGAGGYYRREDSDMIHDCFKRHNQEMKEAMQDEEFATGAFRYELANHEYCITMDSSDAIHAVGLSMEEVQNSEMLSRALANAEREYLSACDF